MTDALLPTFAALLFVIGLLLSVLWVIKRFGMGGAPTRKSRQSDLEILENKALDPKNRLMVIRWKDKELLVAVGHNGAQLIDRDMGNFNLSQANITDQNLPSDAFKTFVDNDTSVPPSSKSDDN